MKTTVLAIMALLSSSAFSADVSLRPGDTIVISGNTVSCGGSAPTHSCPWISSTDANLQNCSMQNVGSLCTQKTGDIGTCSQPFGGPSDWCVCMPLAR